MKIDIQLTNLNSAESEKRDVITSKLNQLSRYYDRLIGIEAHCGLENQDHSVTLVAHLPRTKFLKAEANDRSFDIALASATDVLQQQLIRHKERTDEHIRARKARSQRNEPDELIE